ncbi:MAG: response regulator transcription factor [Chloroflexi bacterium]|nr:response regulator transcription factor [Chloroflexota bacterium]
MTNQQFAALTVLVADQSEIFRRGITRAIQDAPDIDAIWDGEPEQAIEVAEALQPDVALVDIGLPHQRGLKVAWQIRMRNPATATIILSPYEDDAQVFQSVKIGASGFAPKDTPAESLLEQIRQVGNGANLISDSIQTRPGVASQMIQQFASYSLAGIETEKLVSPLTNRESQVLTMISQGHGNKQIAATLGINEQTVKNQMSGIKAKLHANNRTHAVVLALNSGWLDIPADAVTPGPYSPA